MSSASIILLGTIKQKSLLPPQIFYSKREEKNTKNNPNKQSVQLSQAVLLPVVWAAYKGSSHEETKMHWGGFTHQCHSPPGGQCKTIS